MLGKIADLGELGSVDGKVSGDTEGGERDKESDGEKSGVHRRNTFWTLRTEGEDEALLESTVYARRREAEN